MPGGSLLANLTTKEEETKKPTIESHDGPRVPRLKPSTRRVVEITLQARTGMHTTRLLVALVAI